MPAGRVILIEPLMTEPGAAAEMAASCKVEKYVDLGARYIFEPIAVKTSGTNSGEAREATFLYQRISILVQCITVCRPLTARID